MKKHAIILGSGQNALWVARSLGRKNIDILLYGSTEDDLAYHSKYITLELLNDVSDHKSVLEKIINNAKPLKEKPVLFYTSDYWLSFVSKYIEEIEKYFFVVISSKDSVDAVVDKNNFQQFSKEQCLPVPFTWTPANINELQQSLQEIKYPVIIKPEHSYQWQQKDFTDKHGFKKMVYISDENSLLEVWNELQEFDYPIVIQEYLKGLDSEHYSFVAYRDRAGKELVSLCVKKERILPIHSGVASFARVEPDPENNIPTISRSAVDKLNYIGVSSVCLKRDEETGQSKIFEINGRLPQIHSIFQMCGIDLPWIMYQDAKGENIEHIVVKDSYPGYWSALAIDLPAFRDYNAAGELSFKTWLLSCFKIKMVVEYASDDMRPMWYFLKKIISQMVKKSLSKLNRKTG